MGSFEGVGVAGGVVSRPSVGVAGVGSLVGVVSVLLLLATLLNTVVGVASRSFIPVVGVASRSFPPVVGVASVLVGVASISFPPVVGVASVLVGVASISVPPVVGVASISFPLVVGVASVLFVVVVALVGVMRRLVLENGDVEVTNAVLLDPGVSLLLETGTTTVDTGTVGDGCSLVVR